MISDHLSQTAFLEYYYSSLVKIKADVRYNVSIIVDIVWQKVVQTLVIYVKCVRIAAFLCSIIETSKTGNHM